MNAVRLCKKVIVLFLIAVFISTNNVYSLENKDTLRKPLGDAVKRVKVEIDRAKALPIIIVIFEKQAKYAEDNGLWLFAYRRYAQLEKLAATGKAKNRFKALKDQAAAEAEKQLNNDMGRLALEEGLLVSYDGISPKIVEEAGEMARTDGMMNVTTNGPLILATLKDFEGAIGELAGLGWNVEDIYETVFVERLVGSGTKILKKVAVDAGEQGGVSIEVKSHHSEPGVILKEAKSLAEVAGGAQNRDAVMNKIPATPPGIEAIKDAIAEGLYPNVTVVFCSHKQIMAVARAIAEGIKLRVERLEQQGKSREDIIAELVKFKSFISYFVSRVTGSIIEKIEKDQALINKIQNADRKEKERLAGLIMDAAPAFYINAHEIFLAELRNAGFSEFENLGASPTTELDASTGEKAVKENSALVQALISGKNAIPVDELAKILLIEGKEKLYTRAGFYVYRMARPGSMNTIPIKVYEQIKKGQGAKDVKPMTLSEAREALNALETEFGLNEDAWEEIAAKLLDAGVASFITAEQDLRIGILKIIVQKALETGKFEYALYCINGVKASWLAIPEKYIKAISKQQETLNTLMAQVKEKMPADRLRQYVERSSAVKAPIERLSYVYPQEDIATNLTRIGNIVRKSILEMLFKPKSGHPGGSLSSADILTTLYFD